MATVETESRREVGLSRMLGRFGYEPMGEDGEDGEEGEEPVVSLLILRSLLKRLCSPDKVRSCDPLMLTLPRGIGPEIVSGLGASCVSVCDAFCPIDQDI